jgi:hypothetical protein
MPAAIAGVTGFHRFGVPVPRAGSSVSKRLLNKSNKSGNCHAERRFSGAKHLKIGAETLQALENALSG